MGNIRTKSIASPRGRLRYIARLAAVNLLVVLTSCASATTAPPLPTRVPAATAMARVFPSMPTASAPSTTTAASPTQGASAQGATTTRTTTTDTSTAGMPARQVRTDCMPAAPAASAAVPTAGVSIDVTIDPKPSGRSISPWIYGLADSSSKNADYYRDLGTTVLRWGGNARSRHNWEINASNAGSDWGFRNLKQGSGAPGSAGDSFVRRNQVAGAASLLTIPAIGYVAKDGNNDTQSVDVPDHGGAPLQPGSEAIAGYDPGANQRATSLKSVAAKGKPFQDPPNLDDGVVYQDEWVNHLVNHFGRANAGGVQFYAIDNEPDLWADDTHVDIHPVRMSYDAMLSTFTDYSTAIKAVDPTAKIMAPVVSGITGMLHSALDRGDDDYKTSPDRAAHGNEPFLPWFLAQVRKHDEQTGRRSLDVLAVNNYPQGKGVHSGKTDTDTDALRLRSTQQLWNPHYIDESWLKHSETPELQLIPRLREWVDKNYPGTQIAITEWNYGADDNINGGLAIVDVLGIFGREGLNLATYWQAPKPNTPGANAFKLYGNYDGCGRHFGDQLLTANSTDEQTLATYGSRDSQNGDILVTAVNKLPHKAVAGRFAFNGLGSRTVQVYQFDAQNTNIHRLPDVKVEGDKLTYTVPPYSATLFVVKP